MKTMEFKKVVEKREMSKYILHQQRIRNRKLYLKLEKGEQIKGKKKKKKRAKGNWNEWWNKERKN